MAIPSDFSEVEHLQALIRRYLNKEVREHFRDLGDEFWEPEIITTRGAMRHALTHKDGDPFQITLGRMMLYYFTYGKQQEIPQIIEMTERSTADFHYKPEITLYFTQSRRDIPKDQPPATAKISYKIVNETSVSLTETNVRTRANRIKTLFTEPTLYIIHKGKELYTYRDWTNGYDFQLYVTGEAEAKRVIEQVLDIEQKTPDWDSYLIHHDDLKTYSNVTQTKYIYGKNRKVPRRRPIENVKFRHASIKIHGIPRPIYIVDCRHGIPLIKTAA